MEAGKTNKPVLPLYDCFCMQTTAQNHDDHGDGCSCFYLHRFYLTPVLPTTSRRWAKTFSNDSHLKILSYFQDCDMIFKKLPKFLKVDLIISNKISKFKIISLIFTSSTNVQISAQYKYCSFNLVVDSNWGCTMHCT